MICAPPAAWSGGGHPWRGGEGEDRVWRRGLPQPCTPSTDAALGPQLLGCGLSQSSYNA